MGDHTVDGEERLGKIRPIRAGLGQETRVRPTQEQVRRIRERVESVMEERWARLPGVYLKDRPVAIALHPDDPPELADILAEVIRGLFQQLQEGPHD